VPVKKATPKKKVVEKKKVEEVKKPSFVGEQEECGGCGSSNKKGYKVCSSCGKPAGKNFFSCYFFFFFLIF
jgi:hypothetical protein